jgi:non-specific serine/threonine protein kinase
LARSIHSLGYVVKHQGDPGRAAALFEEGLAMFRELDNKRGIAECLLGLASVAAGQGRPERAARLVGASEASLDSSQAGRWEADRVEYERTVGTARTMLGEAIFAAVCAEGRALTLEQAVEYALGDLVI